MSTALTRQAKIAIAAGGGILFLSIGARQGFGLYYGPVGHELGLKREEFARAVAVQYLLWGLLGPVAGLLAERFSARATLVAGGLLYTAGFLVASVAQSATGWLASAGVLIGVGLGGASFGVVNAAVVQAVPAERRGSALGFVAAVTAVGQLLLLFFTQATIAGLGWRNSLIAHGLLALAIVPLALSMRNAAHASEGRAPGPAFSTGLRAIFAALRTRAFWFMGLGFAFSGSHVMFTMTHLPAWVSDLGMHPTVAGQALAAVSLSSFAGSMLFGRLCDRYEPARLLIFLYVARASMAALAVVIPFTPSTLIAYFSLLGLVWMGTIPVTGHLTAQFFGAEAMATVYGVVFLLHQVGGFAGTWLGGVVFDRTGTYTVMWQAIVGLCLLGAVLASLIGSVAPIRPRPHASLPRAP